MVDQMLLIVGLTTACVGGAAYALVYPYLNGDVKAQKRTQALVSAGRDRNAGGRGISDPAKRKKQVADSLKELEVKNKKKKATLEQKIALAGLTLSKQMYFVFSAVVGVVCALGAYVSQEDPLIALGAAVVGAFGLPMWVLGFLAKRRLTKFINEFPGAIDVIIRGVKAGLPVADCFRVVANEGQEPVRGEFRQIVEASTVGLSIGEATERFADRVQVAEASFFSIVINLQQKSGGNLSEALANLSAVLRDRKKMKAKIKAISSEAISSAAIIGSLPIAVAILLSFASPDYLTPLFTTTMGKMMLAGCAVWMSIGIFVMRQMINFEV